MQAKEGDIDEPRPNIFEFDVSSLLPRILRRLGLFFVIFSFHVADAGLYTGKEQVGRMERS